MKKFSWFLIFVFLATCPISAYGERQESTSYIIEQIVLGNGIGEMHATKFSLLATVGQSSAIGPAESVGYKNHGGFWSPMQIIVITKPVSLPWIMLLLSD